MNNLLIHDLKYAYLSKWYTVPFILLALLYLGFHNEYLQIWIIAFPIILPAAEMYEISQSNISGYYKVLSSIPIDKSNLESRYDTLYTSQLFVSYLLIIFTVIISIIVSGESSYLSYLISEKTGLGYVISISGYIAFLTFKKFFDTDKIVSLHFFFSVVAYALVVLIEKLLK
ncbi:MAG: hypothetical protein JXR48_05365 [Candidatus Delongbacteria bacterium]|nr:hypothetical protein [Candidatus Delongbacteria bacterium]MBN2834378.1 hypothetical protein [Candidatus Delongbacteria bacterium]